MILSNALLRTLKENKGFIINISSVTATQSNPHGCAYGATKAGLSNFSKSLFEENRKYGLKVINIQPDMTATNLYRNASFKEDEDILAHLEPGEVADTIRYALNAREGLVLTDITLRPQLHKIARRS
jgi:short-subunit dehydrogenase